MIDCCRLIERHGYYFDLIGFMAEWGMDTLQLHFCDDHGLAVRLPGFEDLAMPNAFDVGEIQRLISHAAERGIEIIPEVETFGHTSFITSSGKYRHLLGGEDASSNFNVIDPLNPETLKLVESLIKATALLFPCEYLHIGCDEVGLESYCDGKGLEPAAVWADYVNKVIGLVFDHGKTAMMWADHPVKDDKIARLLRKDAVMVHWEYETNATAEPVRKLLSDGFSRIIVGPSLNCWRIRFLPDKSALTNTNLLAAMTQIPGVEGMINTIWCPWRYLQNAMYYGIAWSAEAFRNGGMPDIEVSNGKFALKVFKSEDNGLLEFLNLFPEFQFPHDAAKLLFENNISISEETREFIAYNLSHARTAIGLVDKRLEVSNREILDAMILAVKGVWLCSCKVAMKLGDMHKDGSLEQSEYTELLDRAIVEFSAEWDRTRFADDPLKHSAVSPSGREEKSSSTIMTMLAAL